MKVSVAACLFLASSAAAFAPQRPTFVAPRMGALAMADGVDSAPAPPKTEPGGALVPIKEETVEFTAGILGAAAGLVLGGPVLAAVGAAAINFASKTEGEVSDVVNAISKSSIQIFNYLANLDRKYEILQKAKNALQSSLDSLKKQESIDPATIEKVEQALANTNKKIKEINDEYDLVGGGVTALGLFGDLIEKVVNKAGELNEEYQLTKKAKDALVSAVEKAKTAATEAARS